MTMYAGDELLPADDAAFSGYGYALLDPCTQCSAGEDEPCDPWCPCSDCVGE